jgi:hypothetical protein
MIHTTLLAVCPFKRGIDEIFVCGYPCRSHVRTNSRQRDGDVRTFSNLELVRGNATTPGGWNFVALRDMIFTNEVSKRMTSEVRMHVITE